MANKTGKCPDPVPTMREQIHRQFVQLEHRTVNAEGTTAAQWYKDLASDKPFVSRHWAMNNQPGRLP